MFAVAVVVLSGCEVPEPDESEVSQSDVPEAPAPSGAPERVLFFADPPASLAVGDQHTFVVKARHDDETHAVDEVGFTSSHTDVLTVSDAGVAEAHAAGVSYVTATGHGSKAMVEIRVH